MEGMVDLGSQLESFVEGLVEEGRFASREEVLREGVRALKEREARRAEFDAAIAEGMADIQAGRVHDLDEAMDELEARYLAMAEVQRGQ